MLHHFNRRDVLKLSALGFAGVSMSGWLPALADQTATDPNRKRQCILLWMTGAPSQIDTFDPKPNHANGGEFKPIDTSVPGIQIGEHLPNVAKQMQDIAIVRSMSTKEGDHSRAMYKQRTGYLPQGPIQLPTIGSLLSHQLGKSGSDLPNFISVTPFRTLSPAAFGPGFLGPRHAPLVVGGSAASVQAAVRNNVGSNLRVRNIDSAQGVMADQAVARLGLLRELEDGFSSKREGLVTSSHRTAYEAATRMMKSPSIAAFDLDKEPDAVRNKYGRNQFGQGCLLARRLIEQDVPFVEVSLNGAAGNNSFAWDTHRQNFPNVRRLCQTLDPAWSTLLTELRDRGRLETTTVICMGEFGRTPRINRVAGRDHYPAAWSVALCGGGVKGGQVIGKTSEDGMRVSERPVTTIDLLASICRAVGVDPTEQNLSNVGRPIPLVDLEAEPIEELL